MRIKTIGANEMTTIAEQINNYISSYKLKENTAKWLTNGVHEQGAFCTMYTFDDGSFISFNCDIDIITGVF